MKQFNKIAVKAYNNTEFLKSPQARALRILSEFMEPMDRFEREGIEDAIVIFGSARVMSRKQAKENLKKAQSKALLNKKKKNALYKSQLDYAKIDLEMSSYYEDAVKLTDMLTRWSQRLDHERHFVICSGGGPGIMEAANKGAIQGGGKSIGLNISLPMEQGSNPYVSNNLSFEFHYFFMRKFWFVNLAKAMIMFPGGFGTLDEMMEVLTLLQTKKTTKKLPIVLYGKKYWNEVLNFDAMVRHHTVSKNDLTMIRFADTPEEAFQYLKKELSKKL